MVTLHDSPTLSSPNSPVLYFRRKTGTIQTVWRIYTFTSTVNLPTDIPRLQVPFLGLTFVLKHLVVVYLPSIPFTLTYFGENKSRHRRMKIRSTRRGDVVQSGPLNPRDLHSRSLHVKIVERPTKTNKERRVRKDRHEVQTTSEEVSDSTIIRVDHIKKTKSIT